MASIERSAVDPAERQMKLRAPGGGVGGTPGLCSTEKQQNVSGGTATWSLVRGSFQKVRIRGSREKYNKNTMRLLLTNAIPIQ